MSDQLNQAPVEISASRLWDPAIFERRRRAITHYTHGDERAQRLTALAEETFLDGEYQGGIPTIYDSVIHAALDDPELAKSFHDPAEGDSYRMVVGSNGEIQDLTHYQLLAPDRRAISRARSDAKKIPSARPQNTIRVHINPRNLHPSRIRTPR